MWQVTGNPQMLYNTEGVKFVLFSFFIFSHSTGKRAVFFVVKNAAPDTF